MTNDLISRLALKDKFVAMREYAQTFMFKTIFGDLIEVIEREPAVDAAPVVHGRWIEKQEATSWCDDDVFVFYECSVCHDQDGIYSDKFSYCPNCGAKMDGGAQHGTD